jgi:4-hydroxy-2-oxoheptanedioate aldolase
LRELWDAGQPALGGWCILPDSFSAEIVAGTGVDWVCVDMQHGLIDYQLAVLMLQAISGTDALPIVRVPCNDAAVIGKCLDAGARGVIIPMINSADEASRAAAACRYYPDGVRSFGPVRARHHAGADYYENANTDVVCIPMVETRQAVDHVEEIAAVQGVDAIFVGPADLSITLGLTPAADSAAPEFTAALTRIVAACRANGVQPGIAGTALIAKNRIEQGFAFVEVVNDAGLLLSASVSALELVRPTGEAPPPAYL